MTKADERHPRMSSTRLEAIIAAYGADERRWPEAEREAAVALAAERRARAPRAGEPDEAVEPLLDRLSEAAAIDELLAAAAPPRVTSTALRARVLAAAPRPPARPAWAERLEVLRQSIWPFSPLWQPVTALAAAAAVGVVLGSTLPEAASASDSSDVAEVAFGSDVEWDPAGEWEQP